MSVYPGKSGIGTICKRRFSDRIVEILRQDIAKPQIADFEIFLLAFTRNVGTLYCICGIPLLETDHSDCSGGNDRCG